MRGYRMVQQAGFWNLAKPGDPYGYVWISRDELSDLDDAWQDAFEAGALPDWPHDPAAAIGLLADFVYAVHIQIDPTGGRVMVWPDDLSEWKPPRDGGYATFDKPEDLPAAFAAAACGAWIAWRKGQGAEGEG